MAPLGDALALMHGSAHAFRTVRATMVERFDGALARSAEEYYACTPEGERQGWGRWLEESGDRIEPQDRHEVVRLWVERPDRVRAERSGGRRGPHIGIRDGESWWMYDSGGEVHSNEGEPEVGSSVGHEFRHLLDPSMLLGSLRFELLGEATVARRPAVALRARPRSASGASAAGMLLDPMAQDFELAVDRQRGVILRMAARFEGEAYSVTETNEVAFDEPLADDTFVLRLPSGELPTRAHKIEAGEVSLEEAAQLASFPVFDAALPHPWLRRVMYYRGNARNSEPEAVNFVCWLDDASHRIIITQHSSDQQDPLRGYFSWQRIEHEGNQVEVSRQEPPMENRVRIQRGDTTISVASSQLAAEDLADVALAMRRVSSG